MKKDDELIFEMEDYMYLHEWFLGIVSALLIFFMLWSNIVRTTTLTASIGKIVIIYIIVKSIRKFYNFFIKKDIKLIFYKKYILRTSDNKKIKVKDSKEIYKISMLLLFLYDKIKRPNLFSKIFGLLFLIVPAFLVLLFEMIFYKKFIINNAIVIIGKTDNEAMIIPIPYHDKEKYEKLSNYFKVYLNTDINNLQTKYFIPLYKKKQNFLEV